jgi:hypothetical protein
MGFKDLVRQVETRSPPPSLLAVPGEVSGRTPGQMGRVLRNLASPAHLTSVSGQSLLSREVLFSLDPGTHALRPDMRGLGGGTKQP